MTIYKGKRKVYCFLFIVLGFVLCCKKDRTKPVAHFTEKRQEDFKNYLKLFKEAYHLPGVELAIVSGDSIFNMGVGIRNSAKEKMSSSAVIAGGSISEPILAHAILELVRTGKLKLEDKVVKHLPYFKMGSEEYRDIRIEDLLTHTSGIDSYSISYGESSFDDNAPEITTRSIASQQLKWVFPEKRISRSAYNYDILADVIAKASGMPFEHYIHKAIFAPLSMKHSSFYKTRNVVQPFVISNYLTYDFKLASIYPYNRENGGSGGLHTSAEDLAKWMRYVLNGDEQDLYNIAFKTSMNTGIGYGWEVKTKDNISYYEKSTRMNGFSNKIVLVPSRKIGVSILCNLNSDLCFFNDIDKLVESLVKDEVVPSVKLPIHVLMGKKIAQTQRLQDALAIYQETKKRNTGQFDLSLASLEQLGINLVHHVRDLHQAINYYQFCLVEYPASSGLYLNLAEAYILNKELNNGKSAIEKALEYPDDTGFRDSFLRYLKEKMEIIEEKK